MKSLSFVLLTALCAGAAQAGVITPYTPGNLVISQVGGGGSGGAVTSVAGTLTLREFSLSTNTFVGNDVFLPNAGAGTKVTTSANSAEGFLSRTDNQRFLVFSGYNAATGATGVGGGSIATSASVTGGVPFAERVIGRIDNNLTTTLYATTGGWSGSNFRSASSRDGVTFIGAGSSGTTGSNVGTGGLRLLNPSVSAITTTSIIVPSAAPRIARWSPTGVLHYASQTGINNQATSSIYSVVNGVATPIATKNGSSMYDFVFANSNTLYVADDGAGSNTGAPAEPGLQKWTLTGGTWSLAYTIPVPNGVRSIALDITAPSGLPTFYATTREVQTSGVITTATQLVKIVDGGSIGSSTVATLATASGNTVYRGVALTPVNKCNLADVATLGGAPIADGALTADDLLLFLSAFFSNSPIADIASLGGGAGADGALTADDLLLFLSAFFSACD
jgi:hypothetical protein